jgi:hypothetical protein
LGLLAGATYLAIGGEDVAVPWRQSLVLAAFAVAGAALVASLTVVASSPRISADLIRQE